MKNTDDSSQRKYLIKGEKEKKEADGKKNEKWKRTIVNETRFTEK